MGLFDKWKKRKQKKKRSVIKVEDKTEVGKKVITEAKSAIQKKREAEEELLKSL